MILEMMAIPLAAPKSATGGSQSRTEPGSAAASSCAMYGGLETTTLAVIPASGANSAPCRNSTGARSTPATSCSVSWRGMSTRSSTRSMRCRNAATPTAYANGAPAQRNRAARRASSARLASTSSFSWSAAQNRGSSCTAATMSRASRPASSIDADASISVSSRTSAATVPSFGATLVRSLIELLFLCRERERVHQLVEISIERARELVRREADAMVGDAVLRKVVRANLGGSVAGAYLRLAHARPRRLDLRQPGIQDARAKYLHPLQLVLQLRLLILLAHHDPGWDVRDAHRGVRGVHALATGSRRAEDVDAQILLLDLDVDLFGLRQHRDRGRRSVDAPLILRGGHALHAVHARFPAQTSERAVAFHLEDRFLEAAERAVGV